MISTTLQSYLHHFIYPVLEIARASELHPPRVLVLLVLVLLVLVLLDRKAPIAIQSTKFITSFYYIYTKMDNKTKETNHVDKYRSKYKRKRRRFHGYKPEKVTTTTPSESMHLQDGE